MSGVWAYVEALVMEANIIEKKGRRFAVNRSIDGWMDGWVIQYCAALYCIVFYYT